MLDDVPADHPYRGEIEAVAAHCASSGCSTGGFCPDQATARADAVQLVGAAFGFSTETACTDSDGGGGSDGTNDGGGAGCTASGGVVGWWGVALAMVLGLGRARRRADGRR